MFGRTKCTEPVNGQPCYDPKTGRTQGHPDMWCFNCWTKYKRNWNKVH